MKDLRSTSSFLYSFYRAHASGFAKSNNVPPIVLFVFSPQEIDFTLRSLKDIQGQLDMLGVPLFTLSHSPRRNLPQQILELLKQWDEKHLFANSGLYGLMLISKLAIDI